ncbi:MULTISPECIES: flagellar biosynthesis regulator FlaF [unclassified Acidiphilium]|jgi:flagellar biosynthesis regulator FlaF|uniref:flagellar biosynthesis regulator FlaF n=1 Tax=unclassified Acidiphilium TaxID=2617493 RepID=UPI000BCF6E47|nr:MULTISPECIES: flagellar biosynthesis regulator FlaF [unclassified Acidiphilium]OYV54592.1 MAG: hypothetical protein B7Z76_13880 [Acidiphilium sp. 20-67-58]OYV67582.1 MAG: hypothetical protein B7X09_01015 [Acidiphilium sp. 21-66-27]HQT60659.1 flagellar biosynthesis regulator FlaF [Acidiphilium sp.]HQU08295.1 flagellar biosynthesis regulator FlaF [Candidatus Paceibacterota bacterium]
MSYQAKALKAYENANNLRDQRQQDAEVFRSVSVMLRTADNELERVKAIATARRVWQTVLATNLDPLNPLPEPLRIQIVSVANTVLRTMDAETIDLDFVATICDNFSNGLSGKV